MPPLAEVLRRCGPQYIEHLGQSILPSHRRALRDITTCRTEALGGHIARCNHCGHQHYLYHSCRNRSCTTCHATQTQAWLHQRRQELLPVRYFHVVFTLPRELHHVVRAHQKVLYGVLFRAAALSLMKLAQDAHYVGGLIGLLCVLHTWTQTMLYHPHVHCLVPAGGLSPDGTSWLPARTIYLVPVQALSRLFRATFMHLARRALPEESFPQEVWDKPWVVYSKPTVQGADTVLTYLARYVHRIAITNNRILSAHDGTVTFRYKDSHHARWNTMTLSAPDFIQRFLQHVLPKGFHKVRYYGLLSPSNRHLLQHIKHLVPVDHNKPETRRRTDMLRYRRPAMPILCPVCSAGFMVIVGPLPPRCFSTSFVQPHWRAPP
jgi:hypothetical protein